MRKGSLVIGPFWLPIGTTTRSTLVTFTPGAALFVRAITEATSFWVPMDPPVPAKDSR